LETSNFPLWQENPQIDTATGEKGRFRIKTS